MAINLCTLHPGKVTPADANYDYCSAKNETSPGAGDGTPYEIARANDLIGLCQAILKSTGIVPSGSAETQLVSEYLQGLVEIASGRAYNYDESGIANAYVLDKQTNQQGPRSYFQGMKCRFTPGNNNTGASTVNVNGLGIKNVYYEGAALAGGELKTTREAEIIYNGTEFDLQIPTIGPYTITNVLQGSVAVGATTTVSTLIEASPLFHAQYLISAFDNTLTGNSVYIGHDPASDPTPINAVAAYIRTFVDGLGARNKYLVLRNNTAGAITIQYQVLRVHSF